MALNADSFTAKGGSTASRPEPGTHYARLVQVVDKGIQQRPAYQGQAKDPAQIISFTFELPYSTAEFNGEIKPHWITMTCPASNHEKSNFFKIRGVFDPQGNNPDITSWLGTPCMVNVVNRVDNQTKEVKGVKIDTVSAVPPQPNGQPMEIAPLVNAPRIFDFDNPDLEVLKQLPEWLRKDIGEALNYPGSILEQQLTAQGLNPVTLGAQKVTQGQAPAPQAQPVAQVNPVAVNPAPQVAPQTAHQAASDHAGGEISPNPGQSTGVPPNVAQTVTDSSQMAQPVAEVPVNPQPSAPLGAHGTVPGAGGGVAVNPAATPETPQY